jgi:hypothetical protein
VVIVLGPRFVGSNLARDNGFLRAIKINSMASFRREVKLLAPCRKISQNVIDPCGV